LAHTVLTTAGLTVGDHISLPREAQRLITQYPGVITATGGLALLVAVAVTSAFIVRRRLRYETWYFVHLYTYLAIALAFSHPIAPRPVLPLAVFHPRPLVAGASVLALRRAGRAAAPHHREGLR